MIWIHRSIYIFLWHLLSKLLVKHNRRGAHNFCLRCIYKYIQIWFRSLIIIFKQQGGRRWFKLPIWKLPSRLNRRTRWKRLTPWHPYNPHRLDQSIPDSHLRYSSSFYQSLLRVKNLLMLSSMLGYHGYIGFFVIAQRLIKRYSMQSAVFWNYNLRHET